MHGNTKFLLKDINDLNMKSKKTNTTPDREAEENLRQEDSGPRPSPRAAASQSTLRKTKSKATRFPPAEFSTFVIA